MSELLGRDRELAATLGVHLHVCLWSPNPAGTFSMFNPALACPD